MGASSLLAMARRCAIRHIDTLYDVGSTHPYSFWRPILLKVDDPAQLRTLEENCPQLRGETGEIWQRFIQRDIPRWETKQRAPANEINWWKLYRKLKAEADREKDAQEEALKETMKKLKEAKRKNTTTIVEAKTITNSIHHRRFGGAAGPKAPPSAKNAKTALDKLKRSMYDSRQGQPKAAMLPNKLLEERKGRVAQAPKSMVEERRRIQLGAPRTKTWTSQPTPNTAAKASTIATGHTTEQAAAEQAAKEARLRALTAGGASAPLKKRKRAEVDPFMKPVKRTKP
ncbi:uncharacterized protein BDZ99DRAFT_469131 [Mytilinidion resinicola]|uniref:RNA polymerase II transcription factor SIII subunit A n=1 Tax=Mytilinidion resinicola TaxID=574789 RepID=A0A6A6Y0N9_9PEZI|nr:uncharacterized protein BDZ99DRAFT_469131 [Mytilinidion resinicola]KAF2802083.1 hypothetical protein BDZ99DRAFT_469131 [Mytilinidion resinicola]